LITIIILGIITNYLQNAETMIFDGVNWRPTKIPKLIPESIFSIPFPSGLPTRAMKASLLLATEGICQLTYQKLADRLLAATTTFSYGPSIGSILDKHGTVIRSAGTPTQIELNAEQCQCRKLFPEFIDPTVNHVRTVSLEILPAPFRDMAAFGLNYRPPVRKTKDLLLSELVTWADSVLKKVRCNPEIWDSIISRFKNRVTTSKQFRETRGLNLEHLTRAAKKLSLSLVISGIDKAANTASIECIHFYRLMCLHRLQSAAFNPINGDTALSNNYQLVEQWTPWAADLDFSPAILFALAKIMKRNKDHLAYRWITSACNDHLRPLADHLVRILTPLWLKARDMCINLANSTGAKFWWTVECLDLVPHNVDTSLIRPNRKPSAFDLEKCYESIPLIEGEHSLMTRVSKFLDMVFDEGLSFCSNMDYKNEPKPFFWTQMEQASQHDMAYTKADLLVLIEQTVTSTAIFVGDYCATQNLGIPMGSSVSVILLNIYRFSYEYDFVSRLVVYQPELIDNTWEIFAYIDDIGNFSDLDLSAYLDPSQPFTDDNPYWIYPLAPKGPLGIKDQTSYLHNGDREFVYLNQNFLFSDGQLSYSWCDKSSMLDFKPAVYTHWTSLVSYSCKLGIVKSQIRAVVLASSSLDSMNLSLLKLYGKFRSIAYPIKELDPLFSEIPTLLVSTLCRPF
jgi:hypothetical protein